MREASRYRWPRASCNRIESIDYRRNTENINQDLFLSGLLVPALCGLGILKTMAGIHNCEEKNGGACTASSYTPTSHRTHIGKEEAGGRPRRSSIASRRRSVMKQSHRFRAPCVCWKYAMRKSPPELPYACQVQLRRIGESKPFCIYVLFKDGVQPKYCTKYAKLSREVYKVMCFAIF